MVTVRSKRAGRTKGSDAGGKQSDRKKIKSISPESAADGQCSYFNESILSSDRSFGSPLALLLASAMVGFWKAKRESGKLNYLKLI